MLSRRGWVVVLAVLAVAGVVFRWHWLVALGLASIVLSVVPCLIMCALGLCAYRVLGRSRCEKPLQGAEATDTAPSDRSGAACVQDGWRWLRTCARPFWKVRPKECGP
jgi:hypothetical protein